jgi:hypothetical protein
MNPERISYYCTALHLYYLYRVLYDITLKCILNEKPEYHLGWVIHLEFNQKCGQLLLTERTFLSIVVSLLLISSCNCINCTDLLPTSPGTTVVILQNFFYRYWHQQASGCRLYSTLFYIMWLKLGTCQGGATSSSLKASLAKI